jgi:tetratricopeptide (TPR) repeat protein
MRLPGLAVGCLLSLGLVRAAAVQAEAPKGERGASQSGSSAEAEALIADAMAEYERGNWTEARALFESAHELAPTARTLRAIGMCAFEEKSYVMAISYLQQALDDARKPLTKKQRKEVEDALARANAFVARYTLQLLPPDTKVEVDLHAPVFAAGQLLLNPGAHQLAFSASGFQPEQRMIEAQARESGSIQLELRPLALAVSEPEATPPAKQVVATPAPTHATPQRESAVSPALLWSSVALIGVGVAGAAVSWWSYADRRETLESRQALLEPEPSTASDVWGNSRAVMLGVGLAGAGLMTAGSGALGAGARKLPWWLAATLGGAGAGLAAWGAVDLAKGANCGEHDPLVCGPDQIQRDRGALLLSLSAPLLSVPLSKAIRAGFDGARDRESPALAVSSTGLSLRGSW